jgi:hypothetical protein
VKGETNGKSSILIDPLKGDHWLNPVCVRVLSAQLKECEVDPLWVSVFDCSLTVLPVLSVLGREKDCCSGIFTLP